LQPVVQQKEFDMDDRFELRNKTEYPKIMNASSHAGSNRPDVSGYSCPGCTCPHCNGPATRIPRRFVDLLVSMFSSVNRYRCDSKDCGWEGNVRVKRHPLLVQGPW
jgi:hypothetical protein